MRSWLIEARKKHGMLKKDAAESFGISTQMYGAIENGTRRPSPEKAKLIGELFGFDWTRFYEEERSESNV